MRVEVVRQYQAKLPENDLHPYRTGAWTPNTVEVDAWELDVIAGEIPRELSGVYLRNTENPLFDSMMGRYHPFDGDGMIHGTHFADGKASYRNRFVKIDESLEQDCEFVPAKPGDGIALSERVLQPDAYFGEQPVSGLVAQRVVDDLELVEIEEEHS